MSYSQKYCLVSFLQPVHKAAEFSIADWPLHVTLADVFSIDKHGTDIELKLTAFFSKRSAVVTRAVSETILGTTSVTLLNKTEQLVDLHQDLIGLLESNGAVFNTPEYTRDGFLPHCTVQRTQKLTIGDIVIIKSVALVDMYPDANWRGRKVLRIFSMRSAED